MRHFIRLLLIAGVLLNSCKSYSPFFSQPSFLGYQQPSSESLNNHLINHGPRERFSPGKQDSVPETIIFEQAEENCSCPLIAAQPINKDPFIIEKDNKQPTNRQRSRIVQKNTTIYSAKNIEDKKKIERFGLASSLIALLGVPLVIFLPGAAGAPMVLLSVLVILLGTLGLKKMEDSPEQFWGKAFSILGIILGSVGISLFLIRIFLIYVPILSLLLAGLLISIHKTNKNKDGTKNKSYRKKSFWLVATTILSSFVLATIAFIYYLNCCWES